MTVATTTRPRIRYGRSIALAVCAVAWLAAGCMEVAARVTGGTPRASLTAVRMAKKRMFFSPAKARRELGLPQTDVREALRDATDWFVEHGYARLARKVA